MPTLTHFTIGNERGFSQEQFTRENNLDRSYIGRVENAKVNIKVDYLDTIAQCLKVLPEDLVRTEESLMDQYTKLEKKVYPPAKKVTYQKRNFKRKKS